MYVIAQHAALLKVCLVPLVFLLLLLLRRGGGGGAAAGGGVVACQAIIEFQRPLEKPTRLANADSAVPELLPSWRCGDCPKT